MDTHHSMAHREDWDWAEERPEPFGLRVMPCLDVYGDLAQVERSPYWKE